MSSSIYDQNSKHPSNCPNGNNCFNFHNKNHIENCTHPFPTPCPFTPYHCSIYDEFEKEKQNGTVSNDNCRHLSDFAHVCRYGQTCTNQDSFHQETSIHIPRIRCPYGKQCQQLTQEDHLNSFTHPDIPDIRLVCQNDDTCSNHDLQHLTKYRHEYSFGNIGVVRFDNLNKDINFIENQNQNLECVKNYARRQKWEELTAESISFDIIDWIRKVQPVHRCNPKVFKSIFTHGHVMSRNYMETFLIKPECVVDAILQHHQIQKIDNLKIKAYKEIAREYITALVIAIVENRSPTIKDVSICQTISPNDLKILKSKTKEIAEASLKLSKTLAGCGYDKDKDLGTDKQVFSILGPHNSNNYGDIFIVFKREILHHPDSNFSIQAATSYASRNAFKWRPWLGRMPFKGTTRLALFHQTKLHASIPGYEYATALEIISVICDNQNIKTMNIDLKTLLDGWNKLESHRRIEAHLPQLIPLDYIQHIYMTQEIFDSFGQDKEAMQNTFGNRLSIVDMPTGKEYEKHVNKKLMKKFGRYDINSFSRPVRGSVITVPSSNFRYHCVLPLTISQAFKQFKIDHPDSLNNKTIYIYWQVMNGDMMLTLSNQQIDPNSEQPNLRCLVCYLAEKPNTKDDRYHEHESYLSHGRPLQHHLFMEQKTYAAKSTAFHIGCNTNDLMSFCLEIQCSTGKVILSHSKSNLIFNQEIISCTFDRNDLDLNQLNFVHLSAGAHTVPIRNVYFTFEKEPEPLSISKTTIENSQLNKIQTKSKNAQRPVNNSSSKTPSNISTFANGLTELQLIKWLFIYLFIFYITYIIIRSFLNGLSNTTKNENESLLTLWNLIAYPIRFAWTVILIIIGELSKKHGKFSNFVLLYDKIMTKINEWSDNKIKGWTIVILVLTGPLLIDTSPIWLVFLIKLIPYFIWKLTVFIIQYEWLTIAIFISELLNESDKFTKYVEFYDKIRTDVISWCDGKVVKEQIIFITILTGPFLIQTSPIWLSFLIQYTLYFTWNVVKFVIRYQWLAIVIATSEKLEASKKCPNYVKSYQNIMRELRKWCKSDKRKPIVLLIGVLIGPFLIETCLVWSIMLIKFILSILWRVVLFIIRYFWLLIVIVISEILQKNNQCQDYIQCYQSIARPIIRWCDNNDLKRTIVYILIVTAPYLLELFHENGVTTI